MSLTDGQIPYALSPIEIENWLFTYGARPTVQKYLTTGNPPWGIIETGNIMPGLNAQFLLYIPMLGGRFDAANLHISVVTGLPVVTEVQKAPFKSPDDVGFWENLKQELDRAMQTAGTVAKYALVGLGLLVALQLLRK
jgi:hypothetical protein